MKKIILFLGLLVALTFTTSAQTAIPKALLGVREYSAITRTSYILDTTEVRYWYIASQKPHYTAQTVLISLDTLSGNHTNVAVQLQGRVNNLDTWANIGSAVNWGVTTSDTIIKITNTTENDNQQFKVVLTGTGVGQTTINEITFNQYLGSP